MNIKKIMSVTLAMATIAVLSMCGGSVAPTNIPDETPHRPTFQGAGGPGGCWRGGLRRPNGTPSGDTVLQIKAWANDSATLRLADLAASQVAVPIDEITGMSWAMEDNKFYIYRNALDGAPHDCDIVADYFRHNSGWIELTNISRRGAGCMDSNALLELFDGSRLHIWPSLYENCLL